METAPAQTWSPLFAAICAAKLKCATEETSHSCCDKMNKQSDDPNRHFTDSKALFACAETKELLTPKTDWHGDSTQVVASHQKSCQPMDNSPSPSPLQRDMDQRDQARQGSTTYEGSTPTEANACASPVVYKQEAPQ
jgi:hypothetical protein